MERTFLRSQPGENRVLIRIEAGKAYPHHSHSTPDEVFVVEGLYVDPSIESGRVFEPGSYLYYSVGTERQATTWAGSLILVWNAGVIKR